MNVQTTNHKKDIQSWHQDGDTDTNVLVAVVDIRIVMESEVHHDEHEGQRVDRVAAV